MQTVYIMWAALPVLFVVAFLVIRAREGRAARRNESAVDPLFRRGRPAVAAPAYDAERRKQEIRYYPFETSFAACESRGRDFLTP